MKVDLTCKICGCKITEKNFAGWFNSKFANICIDCKRELMFAGIIEVEKM